MTTTCQKRCGLCSVWLIVWRETYVGMFFRVQRFDLQKVGGGVAGGAEDGTNVLCVGRDG
jgi:hypothetical protein